MRVAYNLFLTGVGGVLGYLAAAAGGVPPDGALIVAVIAAAMTYATCEAIDYRRVR